MMDAHQLNEWPPTIQLAFDENDIHCPYRQLVWGKEEILACY